jgi:hypothetical protein
MQKTFRLSNLVKDGAGLTQTKHVGSGSADYLLASNSSSPMMFTRTSMASLSGDYFFEVGKGTMDANKHAMLLAQHAADRGVPVSVVADEYYQLLLNLGHGREIFKSIVAGVIGVADKQVTVNRIPQVTPTFVHTLVRRHISTPHLVLSHMITDFVVHMFSPLGWIIPDAAYIFRIKRHKTFPRYSDLVDVVTTRELSKVLQALAAADLSVVKTMIASKKGVLPAQVAQHLAASVIHAYEMAQGRYDADEIVRSTLSVLGRIWDPQIPTELHPSERVMGHPAIAELRSNLAMFLAYQDMVSKGLEPLIKYKDEELTSVVLPIFMSALAENSPFKVRLLSDVVQYFGKRTAYDFRRSPLQIAIYEDWNFSESITAYVPIKHLRDHGSRYLEPNTAVSTAMSVAMRSVRNSLSMQDIVSRRMDTFELSNASSSPASSVCSVTLGFPALTERELMSNVSLGTVSDVVIEGAEVDEELKATPVDIDAVKFDYYAMITHLATANAPNVFTSSTLNKGDVYSVPYLLWSTPTTLKQPVGNTAIVHGELTTSEPLEFLAYVPDFKPTQALEVQPLPLEDHRGCIHIWKWRDASSELALTAAYETSVSNRQYVVAVDEHEMLGLGMRRDNVKFITPTTAKAVAKIWFDWVIEEEAYLVERISKTKDTIVQEAFAGRRVQNAIHLVQQLAGIGTSSTGSSAARYVNQRIADAMYKAGVIDDYSAMHVGIQKRRIDIWAGLATLQLLGLLNQDDAAAIIEVLSKTNALSMIVGMQPE